MVPKSFFNHSNFELMDTIIILILNVVSHKQKSMFIFDCIKDTAVPSISSILSSVETGLPDTALHRKMEKMLF